MSLPLLQDLLELHMKPKRSWSNITQPTGTPKPPLRTFRELADDYGLSPTLFGRLLVKHKGPAPKLKHGSTDKPIKHYDPKEVKAWWDSLPAEVKPKASA